MRKKTILLVIMVLFLCGCDATVNLHIGKNDINEEITVTAFPDNVHYTNKDMLLHSFRDYIPAFGSVPFVDTEPDQAVNGVAYYKKTVTEVGSGYNFNYKYTYQLSNYRNATSVKEGFKSVSIDKLKEDNTIRFSTDNSGLIYFKNYPSLNNVTINITTDYEVKENNADSVSGNVYTWKFNKDTKKGIYLLLGEKQEEKPTVVNQQNNTEKKDKEKNIVEKHPVLFAVLGILAIFVLMLFFSKFQIKG